MPKYLITIGGKSYIREALPAAVVIAEDGTRSIVLGRASLKAADARTEAESRLLAALAALFERLAPEVAARLARGEMPTDAELNDALALVIQPELASAAAEEFERLGVEVGVQFDPAIANQLAADWARGYTFTLVRGLTDTTRKTLQSALAQFAETPGMTRGQLADLIGQSGAFSRARAEAIAITEVTRAAQAGMDHYQTELGQAGVSMVQVYHTARDESVCPACSPDNGKAEPDWTAGGRPPRHSRCRCFTTLTADEAVPGAKFNPYHDRLGRFATAGSAGGAGGPALGKMKREVEAKLATLPVVGGTRYMDADDAVSLGQIIERGMADALAPYDRVVANATKADGAMVLRILRAKTANLTNEQIGALITRRVDTADAEIKARTKRDEVRQQLQQEALSQIRPMGLPPEGMALYQKYGTGKGAAVKAELLAVADRYPRAWWEASNKAGNLKLEVNDKPLSGSVQGRVAAYYMHGTVGQNGGTISFTSHSLAGGRGSAADTAIHELGHRFEYTVPGAQNLADAFRQRRTVGQPVEHMGPGYDASEFTKPDRFFDRYVGKRYGGSPVTEVLSMGAEAVRGKRYYDAIRKNDPEHYQFILGLLAGL